MTDEAPKVTAQDWQQAATDIQFLANRARGLIAVGEEITRIGSIAQAANEATGRKNAAETAERETSERLTGLRAELAMLEKDIAAKKAEYPALEQNARDSAQAQAGKILAAANVEAKSIRERAEGVRNGVIEETDKARQALKAVKDESARESARLDEIKQELAALRKKF